LEAWLMNMVQSPEERVGERVGQAIADGTAYDPVTSFGMGGDIAAAAANPLTWVDFGLGALAGRIGRGLGLSAETAERLANAPGLRRLADPATVPEPVRATGMTPGGRPTKHFSPERIAAVESALRNNINRDELNRIVQLGRERGGDRWYSGNTILDRFTRALGNEEHATELFRVIAALTAATSPRTQVTDNIDRALNLAAEAFAGRPISELQEVAKGVMGRFNPSKS